MSLHLPTKVTAALSVAITILAVLNETTLHLGTTWSTGVLTVTTVLGLIGVSRLTGEQFRSVLDVTPGESAAVAVVLSTVALIAKADTSLTTPAHAIISGVIVAISGLLVGPDTAVSVKAARSRLRGAA